MSRIRKKDEDEEEVEAEDEEKVMEEEVMMKEMKHEGYEKVQCRASARCTGEEAKLIFFTIW